MISIFESQNIKKTIAVSAGIIILVVSSFFCSVAERFNYNPDFVCDLPGYNCVVRIMNKSEPFMPFFKAVVYKDFNKYDEIILTQKFDSSRMEYELLPGQLKVFFKDHLTGESSGYITVDLNK